MADDEDVLQTAKELLERSARLQQELEHFFQRQAEQDSKLESAVDQFSEDTPGEDTDSGGL
ncbi:hypothetical protein [Deinococcus sp. QL22]|uniref:hypothetical protein n=1 Tax=Deinococcus sp. QL22 TaxID=2939437 RepID=UPI0020178945|nr:hypothetical protein [Deinococcus sp. QL22]UQN05396.1 hypothetical protein M1R55_10965 [Deinococcus sp. QL22]